MACDIKLNYEEVLESLLKVHFMSFSLAVAALKSTEQPILVSLLLAFQF